ncbi:MAG TPA: alpha/beta fold hydrolase [Woeseiaceae bacterium]|nr:alpha/beta fold hydrolase [Woeseiaceae bacterium]
MADDDGGEEKRTSLAASLDDFVREYQPFGNQDAEKMDREVRSLIARATRGMSPVELSLAYLDWLTHLALSPGKVGLLSQSFLRKTLQLGLYNVKAMFGRGGEPPARITDRRMQGDAWQRWPFNVMAQGYQLTQDWWSEATTGVDGVDRSREQLVAFMAKQILALVSPTNLPLTNPEVLQTTVAERGRNLLRGARNLVDDQLRQARGQPPPGVETYRPGESVAVTPGKVIYENRLIEVIQYTPQTPDVGAEPVLITPAWIMKYYILDLSPKNSLVRYLVEQGKTVFMISWKNPTEEDRDLGMDDYLNLGVMKALDAVSGVVTRRKIHLVGYCIGGTLAYVAAARMARDGDARLKSLTIFAAQADFTEAGEIRLFLSDSIVSFLDSYMWKQGYLGTENMGGAFAALRVSDLVYAPAVDRYVLGKEPRLNDLMAWNADGTRMPPRMHGEYLRRLYLDNELAEGRFEVEGEKVHLDAIEVPLFVVGTETDHVAPWQSVYKINRLTNSEVTFLLTSGGHNAGIISGPSHPRRRHRLRTRVPGESYMAPERWLEETPAEDGSWWPVWDAWLDAQTTSRVKPPAMGAPRKGYRVLRDAPGEYVFG